MLLSWLHVTYGISRCSCIGQRQEEDYLGAENVGYIYLLGGDCAFLPATHGQFVLDVINKIKNKNVLQMAVSAETSQPIWACEHGKFS